MFFFLLKTTKTNKQMHVVYINKRKQWQRNKLVKKWFITYKQNKNKLSEKWIFNKKSIVVKFTEILVWLLFITLCLIPNLLIKNRFKHTESHFWYVTHEKNNFAFLILFVLLGFLNCIIISIFYFLFLKISVFTKYKRKT